jgi:hypothetical protein
MNSVVGWNTEIEGFPPIDRTDPDPIRVFVTGQLWIQAVDIEDGYKKVREALGGTGFKVVDVDFDGQLKG